MGGGVATILKVMKEHKDNPQLIDLCFVILGNIAVIEQCVDMMIYNFGVVEAVYEALKANERHSELELFADATSLLRNLAVTHVDNLKKIKEGNFGTILSRALKGAKDSEDPENLESVRSFMNMLGVEEQRGRAGDVRLSEAVPPMMLSPRSQENPEKTHSAQLRDVASAVRVLLVEGEVLVKHNKHGLPRKRLVKYIPTLRGLAWCDPKAPEEELDHIPISYITEVRKGCTTPALKRKMTAPHPDRCFSVIAEHRSLDLETPTMEACDMWIECIEYLRTNAESI
eukprot:GFYU01003581.1.p1 GENE.GFYU01003581.1~~GFYU01003581.1.p1  ORF type:complete len:285 (+),score=102.55 GFYU01003581.1:2-856(+)